MIGRYHGGIVPEATALQPIDLDLIAKAKALPSQVVAAYEKLELQQCAMLPIELGRATNGYIEATEPFKLAKDPAQAARLATVLGTAAMAIHQVLVGLLPILPHKAAAGLGQLGVQIQGKTLDELFAQPLAAGTKLGEALPLFPKSKQSEPMDPFFGR